MEKNIEQPKTREEMLALSFDGRTQEVMHYQLNIDNYVIALEEIAKLPHDERNELSDFEEQLRNLLRSETLEQKKAKIMLAVIQKQLG